MSVLKEKYLMEPAEAELLTSFLLPMLHYYPDSRGTAAELAKHPWLDGVVVQGELDMAENLHKAEVERLRASQKGQGEGSASGKAPEKVPFEEIAKLGPAVKGMVGMGRI
jgi:serine/threonine-protein kinase SRPK3